MLQTIHLVERLRLNRVFHSTEFGDVDRTIRREFRAHGVRETDVYNGSGEKVRAFRYSPTNKNSARHWFRGR